MQRSPNNGQITEAKTQPQPKPNAKRQHLDQEQQGTTSGPQNVQEHPSQPAGLFPEKHARAAATDKLTLGGVTSSNSSGRPGQNHLGKVFYFVEQMKIEVTEADKTMKKMQVRTIGLSCSSRDFFLSHHYVYYYIIYCLHQISSPPFFLSQIDGHTPSAGEEQRVGAQACRGKARKGDCRSQSEIFEEKNT